MATPPVPVNLWLTGTLTPWHSALMELTPQHAKHLTTLYNKEERRLETYNIHTGELISYEGMVPKGFQPYSVEINFAICAMVREGKTLEQISQIPGMPPHHLMLSWKAYHPDFKKALAEARLDRAEVFHDKAVKVLDDASQTNLSKDDVPAEKFKFDGYLRLAEMNNPEMYNKKPTGNTGVGALQIIVQTGINREAPIVVDVTQRAEANSIVEGANEEGGEANEEATDT